MLKRYLALCIAALLASSAHARAQATAPQLNPDGHAALSPAVQARAEEWLHRMIAGNVDRAQLTPTMNAALTDQIVKQAQTHLRSLGVPTSVVYFDGTASGDDTAYAFLVTFPDRNVREIVTLRADGKIDGLVFAPVRPPAPSACSTPNADATVTDPVAPDFPRAALEQLEGTGAVVVLIRVTVGASGEILATRLVKSSAASLGPAVPAMTALQLDNAALKAARASHYAPKYENCTPMPGDYVFRAVFAG